VFDSRATATEFLDRPDCDPALAAASYRFMETVNCYFGGIRTVRRFLAAETAGRHAGAPLRILDIGSGSCDIPLEQLQVRLLSNSQDGQRCQRLLKKHHLAAPSASVKADEYCGLHTALMGDPVIWMPGHKFPTVIPVFQSRVQKCPLIGRQLLYFQPSSP